MKNSYNAKNAYNKEIATNYEKHRIEEPIWDIEQKFIEKYIKSLPINADIIDIPVGTGRFFEFYKNQNLKVHAYDISEDMIEISKNRATQLNLDLVEINKADISSISHLKPKSYTICWRLFHLLPSNVARKAIKELCILTNEEIVVQVFNELTVISNLKNKLLASLKKVIFRNTLSKNNTKKNTWQHIENYTHTAYFIRHNFKINGFIIKDKIHLDNYENAPVYVYILKKIK